MEMVIHNKKIDSNEIDTSIYHHFQPICDIQSLQQIGFEGLMGSEQQLNPEVMFNIAKNAGKLFELDALSILNALNTAFSSNMSRLGKLFLNVYPSTILHLEFQ